MLNKQLILTFGEDKYLFNSALPEKNDPSVLGTKEGNLRPPHFLLTGAKIQRFSTITKKNDTNVQSGRRISPNVLFAQKKPPQTEQLSLNFKCDFL